VCSVGVFAPAFLSAERTSDAVNGAEGARGPGPPFMGGIRGSEPGDVPDSGALAGRRLLRFARNDGCFPLVPKFYLGTGLGAKLRFAFPPVSPDHAARRRPCEAELR